MDKQPQVYIITGPNGSGKTTFAAEFLQNYADCPTSINADTIARGLSGFSPGAVTLKAGRILLEQIEIYAAKRIDFAFETTLSGVNYLPRLKNLKKLWRPSTRLRLARDCSEQAPPKAGRVEGLKPAAGRCSENIELSGESGEGLSADTLLVFQALAEGLQVALVGQKDG